MTKTNKIEFTITEGEVKFTVIIEGPLDKVVEALDDLKGMFKK